MEAHRIAGRTGIAAAVAAAALLVPPLAAAVAVEDGTDGGLAPAADVGKDGRKIQSSSPHGWLDVVDAGGVASGWTCDPDDFSQPLYVHFYLDGPAGSGTFIGAAHANLTREPAVGDNCGGWRNHGFRWALPGWLWDGHWHRLYVHAINIGPGEHVLLQGSGLWFRLGGADPFGWLDVVDADGVVHGWTCDPDDFSQPLYVHFYVNGSFAGHVLANRTREPAVGDACGGWRNHGYSFILPEWVRDGQWRTVEAWAINVGGGQNVRLSGSPAWFRLDPSLETEGFQWGDWGIAADPSPADDDPDSEDGRSDGAEAPTESRAEAGVSAESGSDPAAGGDSTGEVLTEDDNSAARESAPEAADESEEPPAGEPAGDDAAASDGAADAASGPQPEAPPSRGDAQEEQESQPEAGGSVSSTRCEWHTFGATFRQTRHGWRVVTYNGHFRVCYVPNDRIVSVSEVHGDAAWICTWCGWRWLGNAAGYPNHTNFGSRVVLRYRGTAQFCPPQFWCIGTRQPWVEITFFPNGQKRQVIGVG